MTWRYAKKTSSMSRRNGGPWHDSHPMSRLHTGRQPCPTRQQCRRVGFRVHDAVTDAVMPSLRSRRTTDATSLDAAAVGPSLGCASRWNAFLHSDAQEHIGSVVESPRGPTSKWCSTIAQWLKCTLVVARLG